MAPPPRGVYPELAEGLGVTAGSQDAGAVLAPLTSARPIVLLSVPNQIWPDFSSNIMWRTVPPPLGTGVIPKNFSVLGSKPTNRLGCEPVSTTHRRSLSSSDMA